MENPAPKETQHIEQMIATMMRFLEKEYQHKSMERMFHPKLHGCVKAELKVNADLPEELRQGLFAEPATYPVWLRFSNAPPRPKADYKASGRGVGIKIMNPVDTATIQDFLLTTSPVLSPGTVANYKRSLVAVTKGFPHNLPYLLTPNNWRRIYLTLKFMRKHQNLLDLTYFSGSPFLFGDDSRAVKFSLRPSDERTRKYPKDKTANFLQKRLQEDLAENAYAFDFLVQFQEDPEKQPVEDSSREWKTPFQQLAKLTIAQQVFVPEEQQQLNRQLVFSPWNCLEAHRPLGGINRARKAVYEALSARRRGAGSR
jgi:hypothetical protein